MEKTRLDKYRKQLSEMAARVERTTAGLEEQARTPTGGEAAGGLSNAPYHMADVGSEAYNQELGATLLENETYVREEVNAALGRIEEGRYGQCENCGKNIILERLDVLPYARHCTACASALGSGREVNLNSGRPESWLGEPGHEGPTQTGAPPRVAGRDVGSARDDVHAVGTPGGGSEVGGLAGTNVRGGKPSDANLERAMGSGAVDDPARDKDEQPEAQSGPAGGAVGGTPANKRARGTRTKSSGTSGKAKPSAPKTAPKKKGRTKKSGE